MKAGEVKAGTVCPAVEQVPLVRARHSVDSCFTRNDGDGDGEEVRMEGFCLIGDS